MVLLVGHGGDVARSVRLVLDGGQTREVTSNQGVFATALGHNDLVTRIEMMRSDRTVTCKLDPSAGDYACDG
jgi:hypothetical protein